MIALGRWYRTKPQAPSVAYNVKVRCYCCGKVVFRVEALTEPEQVMGLSVRVCDKCEPANKLMNKRIGASSELVMWFWRFKKCKCGGKARPHPDEVADLEE